MKTSYENKLSNCESDEKASGLPYWRDPVILRYLQSFVSQVVGVGLGKQFGNGFNVRDYIF